MIIILDDKDEVVNYELKMHYKKWKLINNNWD